MKELALVRVEFYNRTPIRVFKVSGATTAQWSYCLARLKCGLVKGKHIDEVFGSKTALVWLARSGNADQLDRTKHMTMDSENLS